MPTLEVRVVALVLLTITFSLVVRADVVSLSIGSVLFPGCNTTETTLTVQIPSDPSNSSVTSPLFVTLYGPAAAVASFSANVSPDSYSFVSYLRTAGELELWVPAQPTSAPTLLYILASGGPVQAANAEVPSALEAFAVNGSGGNLMLVSRVLAPFQKHWYAKTSSRRYVLYTELCDFTPGPRQVFVSAYWNESVTLDALTSASGCFTFDSVTLEAQVPVSYRRPVCPATIYFDPPAAGFVHVGARDPSAAPSNGSRYRLSAWNNDADDAVVLPAQPQLRPVGIGADLLLLLAEGAHGGSETPRYSLYTSGQLDTRMSNQSVYLHRLFNHACFVLNEAAAFGLVWNGSVRLVQPGTLQARGLYASLPRGPSSAWPQLQVLVTYANGFVASYVATYPPEPLMPASQLQQWPGGAKAAVAALVALLLLSAVVIAGLVWRVWSLRRPYTRIN